MAERAFVAMGSNIEPERHLPRAAARLTELGAVVAVSSVYQSAAVGPRPAPDFLNAALVVETDLDPRAIRSRLREIEANLGRLRTADRYAPRTIDLDLCLLGEIRLDDGVLTLPDPDVLERAYLARVLSELDAEHPYPGRGETLGDIARRLADTATLRARPDVGALITAIVSPRA